jgi:hypothetical protein
MTTFSCACGFGGYEMSALAATDMQSGQVVDGSDKNTRLGKGSADSNVWKIAGIEAGTYAVYLKAKTQGGNENAYWNAGDQMNHGGVASENGGAAKGDDAYRFKIAVGDGQFVNVGLADKTYSDAGLGSTDAAWTTVALAEITVDATAQTVTLKNMKNGFAMWIYGLRLVKIA